MKLSPLWFLWFVQNSCKVEKHWGRLCGFLPDHSWGTQGSFAVPGVFGHWSNSAAVHLASHGHSHWFPWHQCLCGGLLKRVEKKDLWFSLPALPISNAHCSITKGKIDLQLSSSAPIHFDGWDQPPTRPSLCPLQKSRQCLFGAGDKSVGMTEHSMLLIHQTLLWSCLDKHREKYCQFSTEFQNLLHFY